MDVTGLTVHMLANPAGLSAKTGPGLDRAAAAIRAHGVSVVTVPAASASEAESAAHRLVAEGAERLVVLGGDGMVHLAIQAVAQTSTVLGVLPFGTGNDFAGGVGLPTTLDAAVEAALAPPTSIDLMRVNDERWAASVATLGFSVTVNARANQMRRPKGSARYTLATLRELPTMKAEPYEIVVDGVAHRGSLTLLTIANTSDFGGGMRITPAADASDSLLDLTLVESVGRLELLRWFRKVYDGSHLDHPSVITLRGTRVEIKHAPTDLWADGEPVTSLPATIEAVSGALQLAGAGSLVA